MKCRAMVLFCGLVTFACTGMTQPGSNERPGLELGNDTARVVFDLGGGGLAVFQLEDGVNPFTWNQPRPGDLNPRQRGHFVCFDRWGPASEAEEKNGMSPHGEANDVMWQIDAEPQHADGMITAGMSCVLPLAGMTLDRSVQLDAAEPVMRVTETYTNTNALGRIINMVQHPTIGPPFLDESIRIDTVVGKGFTQKDAALVPEEPVMYWPQSVYEGAVVNFRSISSDNVGPSVTTFTLTDDARYGWVTACNPKQHLLVGYIWDAEAFPWLSFWRDVVHGYPLALGMEFGTTGLHQPYEILVEQGEIMGRRLYEYIDAGETDQKSYVVFLAEIPDDFRGVASLTISDGTVSMIEHGESPRTITVESPLITD